MPHPRPARKKAITLRLNADLVDDFRTFCRDFAGRPLYLTPASFVEEAIKVHLALLKRRVDGGGDLPHSGNSVSRRAK